MGGRSVRLDRLRRPTVHPSRSAKKGPMAASHRSQDRRHARAGEEPLTRMKHGVRREGNATPLCIGDLDIKPPDAHQLS